MLLPPENDLSGASDIDGTNYRKEIQGHFVKPWILL
jgi:hypothetical protein